MDLRRLRHFSELAETLSFRDAARCVHLTQPALTRSIASLEHELGVQLFDRDKRHVALTAAGARLLGPAREVLDDAEALRRAAGELATDPHPELRVGLYGPGLTELTGPILAAFRARHPDVSVRVEHAPCHDDADALRTGVLDVALVRTPVTIRYGDPATNAMVASFVQAAVEIAGGCAEPVPRAEALA